MKIFFVISIILVSAGFHKSVNFAQCSDAGICQIGGHSMEHETKYFFDISASYKFGYSGKDDGVQFHAVQLNGNYNLFDNSFVQFSLPYNIQSGPLGDVNGIGDLILSWKQKIFSDDNSSFDVSLGVKLATGDDDQKNLPQVYQSALGANDILFALNYSYDKLNIGAGYQLAGKRNKNIFRLERGDDLLLRGAYSFRFEEFSITPQLLFIKRLAKSGILDTTTTQETFVKAENSDQAQLNLLVLTNYQVSNNFSLFFDFAVPFIKREVNVDGLTRAFSASVGV